MSSRHPFVDVSDVIRERHGRSEGWARILPNMDETNAQVAAFRKYPDSDLAESICLYIGTYERCNRVVDVTVMSLGPRMFNEPVGRLSQSRNFAESTTRRTWKRVRRLGAFK
jgi:hypothetical protein